MPFALESWGNKAIVVNSQTGKHYSLAPISREKAEAQLRVLKQAEHSGKDNPCWEGYEQIGMKMKGNRKVPNCVPKK